MSEAEHGSQGHGGKPEVFFFFVDKVKYETQQRSLTGAQIKGMIPNFDHAYALFLESHGNDPDVLVSDSTTVDLSKPPVRLYSVPPATFGMG